VVTRDRAIPLLSNVTVVAVTSTVRGLPTEVPLGAAHGVSHDCVANCDTVYTIPKDVLDHRRGALGPEERRALDDALRIALELD
jgi:mRNA interferase MazF